MASDRGTDDSSSATDDERTNGGDSEHDWIDQSEEDDGACVDHIPQSECPQVCIQTEAMPCQSHVEFLQSIWIVIAMVEEGEVHGRDVLDRAGMLHGLVIKVRVIGVDERKNCRYHNGKYPKLPEIAIEAKTEK